MRCMKWLRKHWKEGSKSEFRGRMKIQSRADFRDEGIARVTRLMCTCCRCNEVTRGFCDTTREREIDRVEERSRLK